MMDFSKFRETGELSDITVVVDGKENRLHKFPLFIKSDFFRVLARSTLSEKDRVELADFPGGDETFQLVANYCYNIKVDINRHNVCSLRCAAEFLQMNSTANLTDVTDRVLQDTLTSAKLSRNISVIIELLKQCCHLGEIAQQAKIVDRCIAAIVDCWLIATKFNKRSRSPDRYDINNIKKLTDLPLNWFKQLFVTARDKCVRSCVLAAMLELYLNVAMGHPEEPDEPDVTGQNAVANGDAKETALGSKDESGTESQDQPLNAADLEADAEREEERSDENNTVKGQEEDKDQIKEKVSASQKTPVNVKEVIDALVEELPETQTMAEALSPSWTIGLFCEADQLQCSCRDKLFQLVARLLPRLLPEDLAQLPPELLCEIVQEASKGETPAFRPEAVSATIDQYLLDLAAQKRLSVDVFSKLVKVVPAETRENHDALFQVLETLLTSDNSSLGETDRQRLLDEVDFSRLSESLLQRAYDAELVPVAYVTQAALALCSRLRGELEEARGVIRTQEDELEKYGLGGRSQTWLRTAGSGSAEAGGSVCGSGNTSITTAEATVVASAPGSNACRPSSSFPNAPSTDPSAPLPVFSSKDPERGVDSRLYDSNYDLVSAYGRQREAPVAVAPSYEIRRSLESLERASASPYCGYSRTEFTSPLRYGSYLDQERPLVTSSFDRYSNDIYRRPMATRWS